MVGSIIVSVDKVKTIAELEEKKKLLELRNSSIEKQEKSISSRAQELQEEIKKILEKKSPSEK
jgi:chaperonin cofactor prefoldin